MAGPSLLVAGSRGAAFKCGLVGGGLMRRVGGVDARSCCRVYRQEHWRGLAAAPQVLRVRELLHVGEGGAMGVPRFLFAVSHWVADG